MFSHNQPKGKIAHIQILLKGGKKSKACFDRRYGCVVFEVGQSVVYVTALTCSVGELSSLAAYYVGNNTIAQVLTTQLAYTDLMYTLPH